MQLFLQGKQAEVEQAQRRDTREHEDERIAGIIRAHGTEVELPLTNDIMADFIRVWKKRRPDLGLKIGKKCRADLQANILAFAAANPAVHVPDEDDGQRAPTPTTVPGDAMVIEEDEDYTPPPTTATRLHLPGPALLPVTVALPSSADTITPSLQFPSSSAQNQQRP